MQTNQNIFTNARKMDNQTKIVGQFTCPKCGWVHIGISAADAARSVNEFNEYYESLSDDARQSFGGGGPESIERYKRCFRCGNPSETFVPANEADAPIGSTLQVVIAPETGKEKVDGD